LSFHILFYLCLSTFSHTTHTHKPFFHISFILSKKIII
jgi:hypothetical protein